jgi:alpha-beta hydrolase superfamily lysophospholipase
MINLELFTFPSADGATQLHGRLWSCPDVTPRGVVQLVHGVSEYISRYDRFARFLAQQGFIVAGHDHLGHGESLPRGGTPIWFAPRDGWRIVTDDVYTLHQKLRRDYPDLPCFILGHSMGSFITRSLLIRYPGCVDGAIIMGSGWNSEAAIAGGRAVTAVIAAVKGKRASSDFVSALAFGSFNKPFAPNRTGFDWIAANEQAVDRYIADPKCGEETTVGLFQDMLGGFHFLQHPRNLQQMDSATPILFISGSDDPVGAMGRGVEKSAAAFRNAGVKDVTVILCPGMRHEILNEADAPDAVDAPILRWLEAHL